MGYGTELWTVEGQQSSQKSFVSVSVKCSPKTGKIFTDMVQANNLLLKIFLLLYFRLET